jgi:hypothetical protein
MAGQLLQRAWGSVHGTGPGGGQRQSLGGGGAVIQTASVGLRGARIVYRANTVVFKLTTSSWGEQAIFVPVGADVASAHTPPKLLAQLGSFFLCSMQP